MHGHVDVKYNLEVYNHKIYWKNIIKQNLFKVFIF